MTAQTLAIIVLLVSFFVMIFLRFPIAYAVGLSSVLCMMVQGQALTDVCRLMVKGISSFICPKKTGIPNEASFTDTTSVLYHIFARF